MSAWDITGLVTAFCFAWVMQGVARSDDSDKFGVENDRTYRAIALFLFLGCIIWASFCAARLAGAHL